MDALPALEGGYTETMQQKVGRRNVTPDLLLKYLNTTVKYNSCNICLKAVKTLETCF
jgi:hypothetical protein